MQRTIVFSTLVMVVCFLMQSLSIIACAQKTPVVKNNEGLLQKSDNYLINYSHKSRNIQIELIELKRRNWENHGTDLTIDSDGNYLVTSVFLGKSKKVREGRIEPDKFEDLAESVKNANLFDLKDEYHAPFKTQWAWWGYHLTIRTNTGFKSVKFHSEDENVPESLKTLVENIRMLTR